MSEIIAITPKEQIGLFGQGCSSFNPNESLYGYHGEFFQSSLSLGPTNQIDEDEFYNLQDPTTLHNPSKAYFHREKIHSNDS